MNLLATISLTGILTLVALVAAIYCTVQAARFASWNWLLLAGGFVLLALLANGGVTA